MLRLSVVVIAVAATFCGCADKSAAPDKHESNPAPEQVVAGGYTSSGPVDEANANETAARDLAVAELFKRYPAQATVEGVQVATQVVAGLNYRFTIKLSGGATYEAVVYRDLQDHMSVTDIGPVK
ncbi:MAG: hypothetical protein GC155_06000 [Alphaproteobacteria bacterium]|nr:hypothetical protein [Alphaproteobacteria bacterium]